MAEDQTQFLVIFISTMKGTSIYVLFDQSTNTLRCKRFIFMHINVGEYVYSYTFAKIQL